MVLVALEVLEGTAPFTQDELDATTAEVVASEPTELRVIIDDPAALLSLRTVVAAYLAVDLDVLRPRALLSPDHLRTCLDAVETARQAAKPARFSSFRLSAAGSDSPELERLRGEIEARTGLSDDPDDGDMLLRLRRSPGGESGWQLLVRLSPRPLSARAWRVANYPGALNATIAATIIATTAPQPQDQFIDLMCGSGTLVIERLARGKPARLVAVDSSADALAAARANQRAAKLRGHVEFIHSDVRELARDLGGFDRLVVNLPWGELVGDHATNEALYREVLAAAASLAADDAVFCVLTQDIRRFERCLAGVDTWTVDAAYRFFQKGHRPRLYRLLRSPRRAP